MIIRGLIVLISVLFLYLCQTSVFTSIALAGVVPDLLLILICSVGFMRGRVPAMLTGFVSGLMLDCTFGNYIGIYALIYTAIGYVLGFSNGIYDEDDNTMPLILTACAGVLYHLAYFVIFYLLDGRLNIGYYILRYMVPGVMYTVLVEIVLYRLINLANKGLMRLDIG